MKEDDPLSWVQKAEEDWVTANLLLRRKRPFTGIVCFHFPQRAEKYLKAILVFKRFAFPKLHDLTALNKMCEENGVFIGMDEDVLDVLSSYAAAAHQSFMRAIAQADELLAKTPEYYEALDAKGLALSGLLIGDWGLEIGVQRRDELRDTAIETFKKARKIAPHAGVVKSVLRLFDELAKCDKERVLKEVRRSAEGKE